MNNFIFKSLTFYFNTDLLYDVKNIDQGCQSNGKIEKCTMAPNATLIGFNASIAADWGSDCANINSTKPKLSLGEKLPDTKKFVYLPLGRDSRDNPIDEKYLRFVLAKECAKIGCRCPNEAFYFEYAQLFTILFIATFKMAKLLNDLTQIPIDESNKKKFDDFRDSDSITQSLLINENEARNVIV